MNTKMKNVMKLVATAGIGITMMTGCGVAEDITNDLELPTTGVTQSQSQTSTSNGAGSVTGEKYNRTEHFGRPWIDVDKNGCDTRNDILKRDLTNVQFSDAKGCKVASGTLVSDPYSGETIDFKSGRTTSGKIQIDHIVPLSYAFSHGADGWSQQKRESFANDPNNLIAANGHDNISKSDKGPSVWMPSNKDFQCEYTQKFVNVADTYQLQIDPQDRAAVNQYC